MRSHWKKLTILILLIGTGVWFGPRMRERLGQRNKPNWRTSEVTSGEIVSVINTTGKVEPVLKVSVGSFVSGPIIELHADHNQIVKKGELLAKVDTRLFEANVARDEAVLASRKAEVTRIEALLTQAERDEKRARMLEEKDPNFIAQRDMDAFYFNVLSLRAQRDLAEASVKQAEAALENSQTNLFYTDIVSPVDGMIIERSISEGETLAVQFQTAELFVVAPDMRKKMHVFASVDETDIGLIRAAHGRGEPVEFRVSAYPDDLFHGEIEQIRKSPTEEQSIVTYPVVIAAANPDLKLLPRMTANVSFLVDKRTDTVRIPNAALRFYPQRSQVRKEDHPILDGKESEQIEADVAEQLLSAKDRAEIQRRRSARHVWVVEGDKLRAIAVETGLSDSRFTEQVTGDLQPGDQLVIGTKRG